ARRFKARPTTPRALIHKPVTGTNNIKKCNQQYGVDQPEEVCIKVFASRRDPRIPSVFWVWKSVDFQE
ncbi:NADH:ubiquinone oxidoreductase, 30kDa subunit, partial [Cynara cardunculus var. scolymus]